MTCTTALAIAACTWFASLIWAVRNPDTIGRWVGRRIDVDEREV